MKAEVTPMGRLLRSSKLNTNHDTPDTVMDSFLNLYSTSAVGTLATFDRMLFKGYYGRRAPSKSSSRDRQSR